MSNRHTLAAFSGEALARPSSAPPAPLGCSREEAEREDALLTWFAGQGIPLTEMQHQFGGLTYFQFTASFPVSGGRTLRAYGKSRNRRLAVIKCVAEYVERRWMVIQFEKAKATPGASLPPPRLWTSNGWAVQFDEDQARTAAVNEALERHLLLKSYLTFGWAGFHAVEVIEADGMRLYCLRSRFENRGRVAGMVVAKSALYPGASFGYTLGQVADLGRASFWEPAIYEASDKILALSGAPVDLNRDPASWILSEIKHYLETPFSEDLLANKEWSEGLPNFSTPAHLETYDLKRDLGLDFPFFAAFSWGGGLIPLYHGPTLRTREIRYLDPILKRNGLPSAALNVRHPVL